MVLGIVPYSITGSSDQNLLLPKLQLIMTMGVFGPGVAGDLQQLPAGGLIVVVAQAAASTVAEQAGR